jgi:hypothetical protein
MKIYAQRTMFAFGTWGTFEWPSLNELDLNRCDAGLKRWGCAGDIRFWPLATCSRAPHMSAFGGYRSFLLINKILTMQHKNERIGGSGSRLENHMPMLLLSYPSPTATSSRCPQCRAVANISLIEPDLEPLKERRTFACEECGSSYIYLIDRTAPAAGRHQRERVPGRVWRCRAA